MRSAIIILFLGFVNLAEAQVEDIVYGSDPHYIKLPHHDPRVESFPQVSWMIPDGEYRSWYPDESGEMSDRKASEFKTEGGKVIGRFRFWSQSGELVTEWTKDSLGTRNGVYVHKVMGLRTIGQYDHGKKDGLWITSDLEGRVTQITSYDRGCVTRSETWVYQDIKPKWSKDRIREYNKRYGSRYYISKGPSKFLTHFVSIYRDCEVIRQEFYNRSGKLTKTEILE